MKSIYTNFVKAIAFLSLIIVIVLLYSSWVTPNSQNVELYIELINLSLISIILCVNFSLFTRIGGLLKKALITFNIFLVFFWIRELLSVLDDFQIFNVSGGITDFFELLMIISILLALDKLRRLV